MAETMRPAETTELGVGPLVPPQLPLAGEEDFEIQLESLNQWQLAWRRFKRHRLALIGTVVLTIVILIAILAPILWPYGAINIPGAKRDGGDPPSIQPLSQLFGTDFGGRSVLQQVLVGARI